MLLFCIQCHLQPPGNLSHDSSYFSNSNICKISEEIQSKSPLRDSLNAEMLQENSHSPTNLILSIILTLCNVFTEAGRGPEEDGKNGNVCVVSVFPGALSLFWHFHQVLRTLPTDSLPYMSIAVDVKHTLGKTFSSVNFHR